MKQSCSIQFLPVVAANATVSRIIDRSANPIEQLILSFRNIMLASGFTKKAVRVYHDGLSCLRL
jgi:hypothetical protein